MSDACLQERLKAQKEEAASNPEYGSTYKPQTSKEDRTAKRKQILSNIGMVALLHQSILVPVPTVSETQYVCMYDVHSCSGAVSFAGLPVLQRSVMHTVRQHRQKHMTSFCSIISMRDM